MDNNYIMPPDDERVYYNEQEKMIQEKIHDMCPTVHKRMMPYVDEAIEAYGSNDLSEESLSKMSQHIIRRGGFHSDPPSGYNNRAISDIARFLILNQLLYGGYYPFFTGPYFGGFRGRGGRGFGNFRGRRY